MTIQKKRSIGSVCHVRCAEERLDRSRERGDVSVMGRVPRAIDHHDPAIPKPRVESVRRLAERRRALTAKQLEHRLANLAQRLE
jgi:hypothetical protein